MSYLQNHKKRAIAIVPLAPLLLASTTSQPNRCQLCHLSTSIVTSTSSGQAHAVSRQVSSLFGHLPYSEASPEDLQAIDPESNIRLRKVVVQKFKQMQKDAQSQGILLVPLSGFRSIEQQKMLFFDVAEQRQQSLRDRAEVSAPPGHSEHHTGYAIDIGDARAPATHIQREFGQTAAFNWLQNNAGRYGFELSFPEDNVQGIHYEPWHWRFVGNAESREIFRRANILDEPLNP